MGRLGISLDDVRKAAQQLQEAGESVTIDNIRKHIGSGSKSTILRHMHTLKEQDASSSKPPVSDEVISLVSELWDKLKIKNSQAKQPTEQTNQPTNTPSETKAVSDKISSLQQSHDLLSRQLQVRSRAFSQIEQKMAQQQKLLNAYEQELKQKNNYNQELTRRVRMLASNLQQAKISIQHLQQQIGSLENTKRSLLQEKQILESKIKE